MSYWRTSRISVSNFTRPPVGVARSSLHTRHLICIAARSKTICSFLHLQRTRTNLPRGSPPNRAITTPSPLSSRGCPCAVRLIRHRRCIGSGSRSSYSSSSPSSSAWGACCTYPCSRNHGAVHVHGCAWGCRATSCACWNGHVPCSAIPCAACACGTACSGDSSAWGLSS